MPDLGAPELLIVLVVALLVLGPTRLPKVARSLGEAAREFRRGHDNSVVEAEAREPTTSSVAPDG